MGRILGANALASSVVRLGVVTVMAGATGASAAPVARARSRSATRVAVVSTSSARPFLPATTPVILLPENLNDAFVAVLAIFFATGASAALTFAGSTTGWYVASSPTWNEMNERTV